MINSNSPLDCAFFQLSPRRTRCELFVSANGKNEKLASGLLKPFLAHLKILEEQASQDSHLINLEVERRKNVSIWFNKGTVERFVKFVSTPEVLELVNTLDAEMSQLEGARKMYSQGEKDQFSGESETKSTAAADATKKELLRAIDLRLAAVKQDLAAACSRTSTACFNLESVTELLLFADQFGATRLSEACKNFLSLSQRRADLFNTQQPLSSPAYHPQWKSNSNVDIRSSTGSDMSIDEQVVDHTDLKRSAAFQCGDAQLHSLSSSYQQPSTNELTAITIEQLKPDSQKVIEKVMEKANDPDPVVSSSKSAQHAGGSKRLTVQDRINLFESKQKEQLVSPSFVGGSLGGHISNKLVAAKGEHRRNPSDASIEKLVLRRWSGASDMSIELSNDSASSTDRKESGRTAGTPTSSVNSQIQSIGRCPKNVGSGLIEASKSNAQFNCKNNLVENSSDFSSSQSSDRHFLKSEVRAAVHKEDFVSLEPTGIAKKNEQLNTRTHNNSSMESLECNGMSGQPSHMAPHNERIEVYDIPDNNQDTSILFRASIDKTENVGARSIENSEVQFKPLIQKKDEILSKRDSGYREINDSLCQEQEPKPTYKTLSQLSSKHNSVKARQASKTVVLKFPKKTSETDIMHKYQERGNEIMCAEESSAQSVHSRVTNKGMNVSFLQDSHVKRSNMGDEELNGALHIKAHGDMIGSSQRTKTTPCHVKRNTNSTEKSSAASSPRQKHENSVTTLDSSSVEFHSALPRMIENTELYDISMQKIDSLTDFPRGKLYAKYMQKRDTKRNEECKSIKTQKEAKMKAIHDCLERSQSEMAAKLSSISKGQKLMRSFNVRSIPKVKEQALEPSLRYGDDDNQVTSEPSTGNQSKKPLSFKSLPSTTVASASPAIEHSMKSADSNTFKNRGQTENSVAQSVPKLSNLKNENIKPSLVVNKVTTRKKTKGFARSKSSIEDTEILNEDKSCWSDTVKKKIAKSSELMGYNIQINDEVEQCPRKGNSAKKGSAFIKGNLKSIMITPDESKNKEKPEEIVHQRKDSGDMDMDADEFERPCIEANNLIVDHADGFDGEKSRKYQEYVEPESEYANLMRSHSHLDDSKFSYSKYNPAENDEDSTEGMYGSFNSHVHNSVDFHTDCSSWNSHSLSQIIDYEAIDMRKNGGNNMIPAAVVNASQQSQQSRRDVTKGFIRLLKFGRKSRGADYLVNDCVSASTASEGDDDSEDGRDLIHRPSDDFRKSRMGCSITSYDGFNDSNIFPEQAPRSFFSLSSFRNKAGDSNKPR